MHKDSLSNKQSDNCYKICWQLVGHKGFFLKKNPVRFKKKIVLMF